LLSVVSFLSLLHRPRPPRSPPFPYTTLFRSRARRAIEWTCPRLGGGYRRRRLSHRPHHRPGVRGRRRFWSRRRLLRQRGPRRRGDRKSTRLNSSHVSISYAVFCLKKKK